MTEIEWPQIFGYTVFCEDVREELAGRKSYMGIFQGGLGLLTPPPATLMKLMVVVHYFEHVDVPILPLELRIAMPDDSDDEPSIRIPLNPAGRSDR